jgi:hypothetical protein
VGGSLPFGFDGVTVSKDALPEGYAYRVTRYADVILRDAFPEHWRDLIDVLNGFQIELDADILRPGGNRTPIAARFDGALRARGWGKENMNIETHINTQLVAKVRSHAIDMFKLGPDDAFPGIAVEMEWNNKDPFFDRDLSNFYALHRAGALAAGVIVTRGPRLQERISTVAREHGLVTKYGASTTHWGKLLPRVDIGGGGHRPNWSQWGNETPEQVGGQLRLMERKARLR